MAVMLQKEVIITCVLADNYRPASAYDVYTDQAAYRPADCCKSEFETSTHTYELEADGSRPQLGAAQRKIIVQVERQLQRRVLRLPLGYTGAG